MENKNEPAYPFVADRGNDMIYSGLNKRERFAMAAMQGIISNDNAMEKTFKEGSEGKFKSLGEGVARYAVGYADALLKELGESK